ncbi:hypothetical protein HII13_002181 [Brettanomyces bruxellensis]|nr:hypothetical protein HII13_002181 [Brettanomyces bruxellensis]
MFTHNTLLISRRSAAFGVRFFSRHDLSRGYSMGESFRIWLDFIMNSEQEDQSSQDQLIKYALSYYRSYQGYESPKGMGAYNLKTIIDKKGNYINEIRVENNMHREDTMLQLEPHNEEQIKHLVMLHGYGASAGWFYKNFHGLLINNPGCKIHALDMLGFGLSSRPTVTYKHDSGNGRCGASPISLNILYDSLSLQKAPKGPLKKGGKRTFAVPSRFRLRSSDVLEYIKNQLELVREVESVYVESLEQWRKNNGIDRFDLLGHSFGGYIAFAYASRYPEHVKRLVLVSPGGVERSPFAVTNPRYLALKELADEGKAIPEYLDYMTSHWVGDYPFLGRYTSVKDSFRMIWETRVSFFSMLRWLGPAGPKKLSERNVRKLSRSGYIRDPKEIDLFMRYIYNTALKPSFSETSIMRVFDASVVAKYPILDRLDHLKVPKSLWIYGEHDFMFTDCGRAATKILNAKPGFESKFETVSNAGHNLYLDNHKEFNRKVCRFLGWQASD